MTLISYLRKLIKLIAKTFFLILFFTYFQCTTTKNKVSTTAVKDKSYKTVRICSRSIGPFPLPPWGNLVKRAIQKSSQKKGIQSIKQVFFKKLSLFVLYSQIETKSKEENEFDLRRISLFDIYSQMETKIKSIDDLYLKRDFIISVYSQSCVVIIGE